MPAALAAVPVGMTAPMGMTGAGADVIELGIDDGVLEKSTPIEEIVFDHPGAVVAVVAVVEVEPELSNCVARELKLDAVPFDDREVP